MSNPLTARLEALAAAPKPWLATLYMPNGTIRTLRQPQEAMARSYAQRYVDKYGIRATVQYLPE